MSVKIRGEYRAQDDRALLRAVLDRNEDAWSELVRRFRGLIYHCVNVAVKRNGGVLPTVELDEIFCEVCVNLLRNDMGKLRQYDPARGTKLGTWIGLISIRTCYDHLRAASRRPALDGAIGVPEREDDVPGPLELLLITERHGQLDSLVAGLTPRERCFFELYYRMGLDPVEVAAQMSVSVGTIYAKKNKLRARLMAMAA